MKLDNKPTQRLPYIDIAKAIALMLIVYSHTANCYGQTYLGSFFIAAFFYYQDTHQNIKYLGSNTSSNAHSDY